MACGLSEVKGHACIAGDYYCLVSLLNCHCESVMFFHLNFVFKTGSFLDNLFILLKIFVFYLCASVLLVILFTG